MNSDIFAYIGIDPAYFVGSLIIFSLILFSVLIMALVKLKKLNAKYEEFMSGKDAKSLEDVILNRFHEIDHLKESDTNKDEEIKAIKQNLVLAYQKLGIVKYDAFQEMGGKLSFAIALLDNNNDGFVINAMHSREGCYTYIKEIVKGESFIILANEEKEALEQAIEKSKYAE